MQLENILSLIISIKVNRILIFMLFATKTGGSSNNRSKTPTKGTANMHNSFKSVKRQFSKQQPNPKQKTGGKENNIIKYKTKDSYQLLQTLEEIYNQLNFNEYDIFPLENIVKAKKNIENLLTFLGEEPICRNHRDLLNLYCDNQKAVICVSCVYKTNEHKNHKIKPLQSVVKTLDLQTIRSEQKTKGLVHELNILKQQMDSMAKQIGEHYMMISKFTISMIDESIKQLNSMKIQMEKKLSLAYRRTSTVINRYNQALDMIVNHLDNSMQKTIVMNPLSKHLLLKELSKQYELIQGLVGKFNQNRLLMEQWKKSNSQFEKLVLKKSNSINTRVDSFVVTEF